MENLIKMDDLGVPIFLETPICLFCSRFLCQNVGIDICWGSCGGRIYDAVMSNQEGNDNAQKLSRCRYRRTGLTTYRSVGFSGTPNNGTPLW